MLSRGRVTGLGGVFRSAICGVLLGAVMATSTLAQVPAAPVPQPTSFKFSFGTSAPPGFTAVAADARYNDQTGFGFEDVGGGFPTLVPARTNTMDDSGYLTAKSPVFFSVKLPEGNYRVTVQLGSVVEGNTTVKAELRRLMLEQIRTHDGEFVSKTFSVNVHKPPILDASGKQVSAVKVSGREVGGRGAAAGRHPSVSGQHQISIARRAEKGGLGMIR